MNWHVLTNPYFLGYVLVLLLLVRFGNMLRHLAQENEAERKAKRHRVAGRRRVKRMRALR